MTTCQILYPYLPNKKATAPAGTRYFLISPQCAPTWRTRTHCLTSCCSVAADQWKLQNLCVYVPFLLSLYLCLSQHISTDASCLPVYAHAWPLNRRVFKEVGAYSAGLGSSVFFSFFFCLPQVFFFLNTYCRRKQRARRDVCEGLWFLFSVSPWLSPGRLTAMLGLQQSSSEVLSKGKYKVSSSWTILWGCTVPLHSCRLKSGQLETQGVLRISYALHELHCWERAKTGETPTEVNMAVIVRDVF